MPHNGRHILILLLLAIAAGCTPEQNPVLPPPDVEVEKPIIRGLQRLHGYWKAADDRFTAKYYVADTITSRFVIKYDLGYGFHYLFDPPVVFTDSTIISRVADEPWYHYRFTEDADTLILAKDTAYSFPPYRAVVDSVPQASSNWLPIIRYLEQRHLSSTPGKYLRNVEHNGDSLYFHYDLLVGSEIEIRGPDGVARRTIVFPDFEKMDIADGYLWLASREFIEKRALPDTSLIQRFNIGTTYQFEPHELIQSFAVGASRMYLFIEDYQLTFDSSGALVSKLPSTEITWCANFIDNQLLVGTNHSTIHTVDVETGHATASYLLPEGLFGDTIYPILGVFDLGGNVGAIRQYHTGLNFYEFAYPQ